jgi:hypothetical protein
VRPRSLISEHCPSEVSEVSEVSVAADIAAAAASAADERRGFKVQISEVSDPLEPMPSRVPPHISEVPDPQSLSARPSAAASASLPRPISDASRTLRL